MISSKPSTSFFSVMLRILILIALGKALQPNFTEPIGNLTIPKGRDATLRCSVTDLGGYRIGWVKADTKAIQAIHHHVITHNTRIAVSHVDQTTWNLHIKNIQEEDTGQYMCQINTNPMLSQMGSVAVVVPPDFIADDTSGDTMVPEGGKVKLTCNASGHPTPRVHWKREDGKDIVIRDAATGQVSRVAAYYGQYLRLEKISRSDMGAYFCIASNGVPPSISKRIMLDVHFHPAIQVPNQLVGAPFGTDVTLECNVEAAPKSINYWIRDTGEMVIASSKFELKFVTLSLFEVRMILIVRNFQKKDAGSYKCIAKNSLGEAESNIRLYEIPGPTLIYRGMDEEDYNDQFGSAEREREENEDRSSNKVVPANRIRPAHHAPAAPKGTRNKHVPPTSGSAIYFPILQMMYPLSLMLIISFPMY